MQVALGIALRFILKTGQRLVRRQAFALPFKAHAYSILRTSLVFCSIRVVTCIDRGFARFSWRLLAQPRNGNFYSCPGQPLVPEAVLGGTAYKVTPKSG